MMLRLVTLMRKGTEIATCDVKQYKTLVNRLVERISLLTRDLCERGLIEHGNDGKARKISLFRTLFTQSLTNNSNGTSIEPQLGLDYRLVYPHQMVSPQVSGIMYWLKKPQLTMLNNHTSLGASSWRAQEYCRNKFRSQQQSAFQEAEAEFASWIRNSKVHAPAIRKRRVHDFRFVRRQYSRRFV